jgi:hypothetical protein
MRIKLGTLIILAAALLYGGPAHAQQQQKNDSDRWLQVEVTDVNGQPLKRACVTFVPPEGEIVFRNADSRGHVRLKKLSAAKYRVVVKVEGYKAQKREVTIGSGNETVAFSLQPRENR